MTALFYEPWYGFKTPTVFFLSLSLSRIIKTISRCNDKKRFSDKFAHSLIKRSVHCACIKCLDNKCAARIVRILYGPPSLLSPSYREKWAKCSRGIVTGNLYRSEIISDSRFDAPVREPPFPRTLSAAPRAAQDSAPEVPQVWSGWRSFDGGRA